MRSMFRYHTKRISKTRFKSSVILLSALTLMSSGLPAYADANGDLQKGEQLLMRYHYRDAVEYFDRALKQNPRLDYAYALRGQAYLVLENYEQASSDLNHAIALDKTKWLYFHDRAKLRFELSDIDGAIADATTAIKLSPKEDNLYRLRSKFYSLQKKYDKALADLNKAIEFQQKDMDSHYKARGDMYFRLKKYDLAVKDYSSAIAAINTKKRNDKDIEKDYSARANAYEKLGETKLAAADRKKVQSMIKDGWGSFMYEEHK
jgi:tetratricopeptide (TPR) repeat protein